MLLGIYGTGGFSREVLMLAEQVDNIDRRWNEIVFIEDMKEVLKLEGKSVLRLHTFAEIEEEKELVIAVGEPSVREEVYDLAKGYGIRLCTLIHQGVHVDKTVSLGEGSIIMGGVYLGSHAVIGANTVIQLNTIIGHDTNIGMHCTISSNCCISGTNQIGDRTYFGFLSGTKQNLKVGNDVICSAGAIVFRDLPDAVIAVGNPARIMKKNEEKRVFGK